MEFRGSKMDAEIDRRRHERLPMRNNTVSVTWVGAQSHANYSRGTCRDVSRGGFGFYVMDHVPKACRVSFRIPTLAWSGRATIRHCTRIHMKYMIGRELSEFLTDAAVERLAQKHAPVVTERKNLA